MTRKFVKRSKFFGVKLQKLVLLFQKPLLFTPGYLSRLIIEYCDQVACKIMVVMSTCSYRNIVQE